MVYKSKGEQKIADFLEETGFDFEYEFPVSVIDDEGKHRVWYPDFYLKEFQIVVEYFGMYYSDENYRKSSQMKKKIYNNCGIEMIPMYKFNQGWQEWLINKIFDYSEYKTSMIMSKVQNHTRNKFVKEIKKKRF